MIKQKDRVKPWDYAKKRRCRICGRLEKDGHYLIPHVYGVEFMTALKAHKAFIKITQNHAGYVK